MSVSFSSSAVRSMRISNVGYNLFEVTEFPEVTVSKIEVGGYDLIVGSHGALGEPSETKVKKSMEVTHHILKEFIQKRATEDELRELALDLLEGIAQERETGKTSKLDDDLDSWSATAEILLDDDAVRSIENGHAEIERGDCVTWKPGQFTK